MGVFTDLNELPKFRNPVVTIGSFDGVHLGHQQILRRICRLAEKTDGESIVITFHPHPRLVVYPKDKSLRLITSIDEKVDLISQYGVDHIVVVPFTVAFSQQSADEYIQKFLVGYFRPKHIVIGYDHRFGLNRQGDIKYLKWHGKEMGYEVLEIAKHEVDNIAISSTKIRNALLKGDMQPAHQMMGHPFLLTGVVVHGNKIGHSIGFPTANLEVRQPHKLIPPNGIYSVYVWHQGHRYGGMLYIGDRPTLAELKNRTIEVNIFDFDKDIYGDKLRLELLTRIRDDAQFDGLEALSAQLAQDKEAAREALSQQAKPKKTASPSPALFSVVILNYNGREYLQKFLPGVLNSTYANFEVIVADNGSTDDSLTFLAQHYPHLRVIDLQDNHGFAQGYNLALQQVEAPYYILLNSDVRVTPNWIEPIAELMERDPTVGACQPKILAHDQPDTFEYAGAAGGWIDNLGYPFCRGRLFAVTEKDEGQYDGLQEVFWATGAALFVRSQLFHGLGGFDGDYFAHSEEIDLCWRIKRAGYKVMAKPRSVVYHVGGGTLNYNTPRKTYLNFRNSLCTLVKNETRDRLRWLLPLRLVLDGLAAALFLFQGKWKHIQSVWQAHQDFFPQWKHLQEKRHAAADLVQRMSIHETPNMEGRYKGSIVWQYYARGKRHFRDL